MKKIIVLLSIIISQIILSQNIKIDTETNSLLNNLKTIL
jgi:hypothetical protein